MYQWCDWMITKNFALSDIEQGTIMEAAGGSSNWIGHLPICGRKYGIIPRTLHNPGYGRDGVIHKNKTAKGGNVNCSYPYGWSYSLNLISKNIGMRGVSDITLSAFLLGGI